MTKSKNFVKIQKYQAKRKSRQITENKQIFDWTRKIEINKKSRQNAEKNKQIFDLSKKIKIGGKSRQNETNLI